MSGVVCPGGGEEELRQKLGSRGANILLARAFRRIGGEDIRPPAEGVRNDALDRFRGGAREFALRKIRHLEPGQRRDAHGGDQRLISVLRQALRLHPQQLRLRGGLARLRHLDHGTYAMGMTLFGGDAEHARHSRASVLPSRRVPAPLAQRNRRGSHGR